MRVEITYDGGFENIAEHIQNSMSGIIAEMAQNVCDNARTLCPVDTGRLRDSITAKSDGNNAVISADTEYAAYQEFGTSKIAPQPYLVPALIALKDNIGTVFESFMAE